jgi:hypothetical protein
MSQPSQVEIFFPEQPFGGVLIETPESLKQIAINSGSPVQSVFGRIGNVGAQCSDYAACYQPAGGDLPDFPGKMRIKADGSFQLWNPDQLTWHTLGIGGLAGAEYITISAGEPP